MAINTGVVRASPRQVFAILSNPKHYGRFVVGTRRIRVFDPAWPQVGSEIHHSLGYGITLIRDASHVLQVSEPDHLALYTAMGPLGAARTDFRLRPDPGGTRVEVEEVPVAGFVAIEALSAVVDRMIWLRNCELLRRLRQLAEQAGHERVGGRGST